MACRQRLPFALSFEELDRELIARGAQVPEEVQFTFKDSEGTPHRHAVMTTIKNLYHSAPSPNQALNHISTWQLIETFKLKIQEESDPRGVWGEDNRMDFYNIPDDQIKKNAGCVAAICLEKNLINKEKGFLILKVKNYGAVFNLCRQEPFRNQPISTGWLCTGFLVKEDIIATAGHCANENNVKDLRIVFGFKMLGASTSMTWIPNEDIYKGIEIIGRAYNHSNRDDWALVKLDRKVKGHPLAKLSEKPLYLNQPVYILGHPCGLPLKYSAGAKVCGIDESFFSADLNVYCGNSGSPVFDKYTHEVIGLVVRGDNQDFRWTGEGWRSIIYPHPDFHSKEPQCTRASQFIDYCR